MSIVVRDMNDLISVVVPVYNTGNYLKSCVTSIIQQDYQNFEILLVDDGSNDVTTIDLCDKLADTYENVLVYHKQNGGSASARNYGIIEAKGKYIGFVDSDDVIDSNMFSTLYSLIKKDEVKVSICGISTEENGRSFQTDQNLESGCYGNHDLMHHFLLGHWHSACTCLYEKSLFDSVSFPEGEVNEDYMLNYLIFKDLDRISFTREPFYHYLRRVNSNTGAPKTLRFLDWIKHTQFVLDEMSQDTSLVQEAEYQYLYSNIILGNSALLTLDRVETDEAKQLYKIVSTNLRASKKMLHRNSFLSKRIKMMGIAMAYTPGLYKWNILTALKIKRFL